MSILCAYIHISTKYKYVYMLLPHSAKFNAASTPLRRRFGAASVLLRRRFDAAPTQLAAQKKLEAAHNPSEATATSVTPTLDPVALAMARVKAKEQDPQVQKSKLERALTSAQGRVDKLQTRLGNAEQSHIEKLTAQVKQAQLRTDDAQKHLDAVNISIRNPEAKTSITSVKNFDAPPSMDTKSLKRASAAKIDTATEAIERAKLGAETLALMSPEEKLQQQLASLTQRLVKSQQNLDKAEADGSEHITAFKVGLEKTQAKLTSTEAELTRLQKENS